MAIQIFQQLESKFEEPIRAFVESGVSELASAVDAPLRVAATLYVILYGFSIWRGIVQTPIMEFAFRSMKLVIIITLATKVGTYNSFVTDVFFDALPRQISEALAGGGALNANSFDTFLQKGFLAGHKILQEAGLTNWGPALVAAIVFVATVIGTVLAYAVCLYAKVALSIMLALGPIFIGLAMFEPTRRMTQGWIGQVLNYVVLQVLVTAVLLLIVKIVDPMLATVSGGEPLLAGLLLCVLYGLAAFIAYQLPGIASQLAAGGAALSFGVAAAGTAAVAGTAVSVARRAAGATGRAGLAASNRMMSTAMHGRNPS